MSALDRDQLVRRVERLLSGKWDDQEMEQLFREISENVPCPFARIQHYIFHTEGLTPEQMVDKMLQYKAVRL